MPPNIVLVVYFFQDMAVLLQGMVARAFLTHIASNPRVTAAMVVLSEVATVAQDTIKCYAAW